jgi:8-oxo-dGTP diphosphatase
VRDGIVEVAAGVIFRGDGRFLLGRRASGTFYPGYWEFPGGKVETGEAAIDALVRELHEELDIRVTEAHPWLSREHEYEHAHVRLDFFEVVRWTGDPRPHVHQALSWERVRIDSGEARTACAPLLPANGPVLKALALPRYMGITQAASVGVDAQLAALDYALGRGLRLVQVREAGLSAVERVAFAAEAIRRAHAVDALVLINGDGDLVRALGADGLHLPASALMASERRPAFAWVGASCHTRAELEHAARLGLDYALLGAVEATSTHPGAEPLGWARFAACIARLPLPVFALGGLGAGDMKSARRAGAHGIAAIRACWRRAEPGAGLIRGVEGPFPCPAS